MHTVMNAEGEIAEFVTGKAPERPELTLVRDETGKFVSPKKAEPEPPKAPEKAEKAESSDDDDVPAFVKRFGLTEEQNKGITEVFAKEIGKKNLRRKEAEDFAAAQYNERMLAEQRAENLERELAKLRTAAPEKPVEPPQEPKREDFKTDQEYWDKVLEFRVEQKFREREAAISKEREAERALEVMAAAAERISKATELVSDYAEVTGAVDEIIPAHIAGYMQESEMFAELGYHLAKHPELITRLQKLPLARGLVEIGKIEGTLKPFAAAPAAEKLNGDKPSTNGAEPTETGQPPSQPRAAAPVIQPLNVGSASQVEKPVGKMNYDEARADWEKKHGRNFNRRQRH